MNQRGIAAHPPVPQISILSTSIQDKDDIIAEKIEIEKSQRKKNQLKIVAPSTQSWRRAIVWRRVSPLIAGQIVVGPLVDPNIIDGVCSAAEITFCLGVSRGTDWQFKGERSRGVAILQSPIVAGSITRLWCILNVN